MPGFLTPERRQKAKQRSRANQGKTSKSAAATKHRTRTASPSSPSNAKPDSISVSTSTSTSTSKLESALALTSASASASASTAKPSPDTVMNPPRAVAVATPTSSASLSSPPQNQWDTPNHSYEMNYDSNYIYNYNSSSNSNSNHDYNQGYSNATRSRSFGDYSLSSSLNRDRPSSFQTTLADNCTSNAGGRQNSSYDEYEYEYEYDTHNHNHNHSNSNSNSEHNEASRYNYASYDEDEDMPMDELMGMQKKQQAAKPGMATITTPMSSQNTNRKNLQRDYRLGSGNSIVSRNTRGSPKQMQMQIASPPRNPAGKNPTYGTVTPTREVSDVLGLTNLMAMVAPSNWNSNSNDNSASVGGDSISNSKASYSSAKTNTTSTSTGIQRMIAALGSGSTSRRPANLTRDECILWDSLQTAMVNDRNAHLSQVRALEQNLQHSNSLLDEVVVQKMDLEREVSESKTLRSDLEHRYAAMAIVLDKQHSRSGEDDSSNSNKSNSKEPSPPAAGDASTGEGNSIGNSIGNNYGNSNNNRKRDNVHQQLQQIDSLQQALKQQKESHDDEVLAIQRVLADVTAEKMRLEEQQQQQQARDRTPNEGTETESETETTNGASANTLVVEQLREQLATTQHQLETASREAEERFQTIAGLKADLETARAGVIEARTETEKLATEKLSGLKAELVALRASSLGEARAAESEQRVTELEAELASLNLEHEALHAEAAKLETEKLSRIQAELVALRASSLGEARAAEAEQRVTELEAELASLKIEHEALQAEAAKLKAAGAASAEEAETLKQENTRLEEQVETRTRERDEGMAQLEAQQQETQRARDEVEQLMKEHEAARDEIEKLQKAREHAVSEVEKAILEAKAVKADHPAIDPSNSTDSENRDQDQDENDAPGKSSRVSAKEFEELKKTLSETTVSLETSKKIIASLENANGSLALDSRTKLKEKEEELSVVQKESEERKKLLDSLATSLRDLERNQGSMEDADRRAKAQITKQKALKGHLESSLTDLQQAVAIHECCFPDNSNIDEISEILGDTLHAIRVTLESAEEYVEEAEEMDAETDAAETNAEAARHADAFSRKDREARRLKYELDQKKIAVKRLEEALKKQNDEMKKFRYLFDARGRGNAGNENNNQLRAEIQSLRQQCTTNMEVLAKKERELSVLRLSLKVDENESGYISDDASDDEDDEGTEVGSTYSAAKLNGYGPADAEAYATILSQANGRIGMQGSHQIKEIESLKKDLLDALGEKESASKELQARRESLANAKMIISSLEKANNEITEDLRSRLQDSNIAIASLLKKSKAHENESDDLRKQLQKLEQEKVDEHARHEAELRELRRETKGSDGNEIPLEEKKEEVPSVEH